MSGARIAVLAQLAVLAGCDVGGDRDAAAKALIAAQCGACHIVPGVRSAVGRVGPSLAGIASRQLIAGRFTNNRPVMVRWLMHPQVMAPDTAMPNMGLDQSQAKVITNYLDTLN